MTSILHGFVIGVTDYKETDRFYTIYTKERGRMRIMGKGTLKFQSKLAPHMTPFTELKLMIAHGKIWGKLASVERMVDYSRIRDNLDNFGLGLGLNELLYRAVSDGEPDALMYEFIREAYSWIQTLPELSFKRLAFVNSALTLKWLVLIGFGPHCDACVGCNLEHSEISGAHISVSHGGLVCTDCVHGNLSEYSDSVEVDFEMLAAIRFLGRAPFESLMTQEIEGLLDSLIEIQDEFVRYHLDRDLRVPVFLNQIKRHDLVGV